MLVDALVALGVLALIGGSALQVTRSGLQRAQVAELRTLGRLEAQSRMDEVGGDIAFAPGVTQGQDGPLTWRVQLDASEEGAGSLNTLVTVSATGRELARLRSVRGPS